MIWYAEQVSFDGKFRPVLFHQKEKPTGETVEGKGRRIRGVRLVPAWLYEQYKAKAAKEGGCIFDYLAKPRKAEDKKASDIRPTGAD